MPSPLISLILIVMAVLLGACSPDTSEAYTELNETGFMAACTRTGSDIEPDLLRDAVIDDVRYLGICECSWESLKGFMDFEEFVQLDLDLVEGDSGLPRDIVDRVADCAIDELEL